MPERSYRFVLWALALFGLLLDQGSKYGVFAWLHGVESNTYALFQAEPSKRYLSEIPGEPDPWQRERQRGFFLRVSFEPGTNAAGRPIPHVNHGALFGFLQDHKSLANGGFALISLLAAVAIIVWSNQRSTASDRWLCARAGSHSGRHSGQLLRPAALQRRPRLPALELRVRLARLQHR